MARPAIAHSHPDFPEEPTQWEPLFSSFGERENKCQRNHCEKCRQLSPGHGHLNKVAYWSAKFAVDMFPTGSSEAKSSWNWGNLAGLWHDLGKFAPEWQAYLATKADIHFAEVTGGQKVASSPRKSANSLALVCRPGVPTFAAPSNSPCKSMSTSGGSSTPPSRSTATKLSPSSIITRTTTTPKPD